MHHIRCWQSLSAKAIMDLKKCPLATVHVCNGTCLQISHIGSNFFNLINSMLCASYIISTNLISVHHFTNDNNYMFITLTHFVFALMIKPRGRCFSTDRVKMVSIHFQFIGFPTSLIKLTLPLLLVNAFLLYGILGWDIQLPLSFNILHLHFSNMLLALPSISPLLPHVRWVKEWNRLFNFFYYLSKSFIFNSLWSLDNFSRIINKWVQLLYLFYWWLHQICLVLSFIKEITGICRFSKI